MGGRGSLGGPGAAKWGPAPEKKDPRAIGEVLGLDDGDANAASKRFSQGLRNSYEEKPAWAGRLSDGADGWGAVQYVQKTSRGKENLEDYSKPIRRSRKHGKELALQLTRGWCEANILLLTMDEIGHLADSIRGLRGDLQYLRLTVVPRKKVPYTEDKHKVAVINMADLLAHRRLVGRVQAALTTTLRLTTTLVDLELGAALHEDVMAALGTALGGNNTVRRLSLAGSYVGDVGMCALTAGLRANNSLEEVDFSACHLTDRAGAEIATVVKAHSARRAVAHWEETLRSYGASDPILRYSC
mmetsp:Transcript_71645/g.226352  ORF Transcript_71645/g.226352 Transcript_71645/m.226352 type:complete len:300 (+) Transcript_71645:123-1022(+)